MNFGAQSSIEYLLLLAAFFGVLGVMLPVMSTTTQSFVSLSDEVVAKNISKDLNEQISLMSFLGVGSTKQFDYFATTNISISSQGTKVILYANEKEFLINTGFIQIIPKQDFSGKFSIVLQKKVNGVQVTVIGGSNPSEVVTQS